jgi:D-glycerate 3-kinase
LNGPLQLFLNRHSLPDSYLTNANTHFSPLIDEFAEIYQEKKAIQIIGINGCQGSGKSTLADYLCTRIANEQGVQTLALSMDDFYCTKAQRKKLSDAIHPLLATRGVPGTHDIDLAIDTITALSSGMSTPITRFNKSTDERVALADSKIIKGPVALIVVEGWCFGAQPVSQSDLLEASNSLEQQHDTDGVWRQYVNRQLKGNYQTLFNMTDRLVMLAAPSFDRVFEWRLEQEQKLAQSIKLKGNRNVGKKTMNEKEVKHFIAYFQRITEHCLLEMPARADHLFRLNDDRSIHSYNSLSIKG